MTSTRSKLDEIVASFSTLEDPRSHINRRHPLPSILIIAVSSMVVAMAVGALGNIVGTAIAGTPRLGRCVTRRLRLVRTIRAGHGGRRRRGTRPSLPTRGAPTVPA